LQENVSVTGNVSISGALGAAWTGCGGALLSVAPGAWVSVVGLSFESTCGGGAPPRTVGILFAKGASGRVERCSFATEVGVQLWAEHLDARRNFWGAQDGPPVHAPPTTGGRRAGGGLPLLAGPRAR
jgi:hypothetical protein